MLISVVHIVSKTEFPDLMYLIIMELEEWPIIYTNDMPENLLRNKAILFIDDTTNFVCKKTMQK